MGGAYGVFEDSKLSEIADGGSVFSFGAPHQFMNNLVMYDRSEEETLFSQIMGEGVCGPRKQTVLPRLAISEMTWEAWQGQFPSSQVMESPANPGRFTLG